MAVTGLGKILKKRKQEELDEVEKGAFAEVDLEMQSEEEAEDEERENDNLSDGEVDDFPEIDALSDSDEESEEEDEDGAEEDTLDENSDADSDLQIFPESKVVVSDITGQKKIVYPEIEPDYDSDSSTEEVSRF